MAFESLSEKLSSAFKKLTGKGRLKEADVKEAMREVKLALLEAVFSPLPGLGTPPRTSSATTSTASTAFTPITTPKAEMPFLRCTGGRGSVCMAAVCAPKASAASPCQ